ncbi:hypothetical protein H7347_07175 [Corynebacterium sp. zg-331]|uniref:hypothetical protein n=1 Tax=unclassified Corynebacterium TaxID=2624378 RepID=UPI00128CD0EC|nr:MULTISPECIES: hypothetical protein [unclassified Corynebacterium]MBC3186354.1 hypothetical protein [Corynebacterium sp. zg-331]MPV52842.1 hypothetical protein [Corynebacterium sp. zg331]
MRLNLRLATAAVAATTALSSTVTAGATEISSESSAEDFLSPVLIYEDLPEPIREGIDAYGRMSVLLSGPGTLEQKMEPLTDYAAKYFPLLAF